MAQLTKGNIVQEKPGDKEYMSKEMAARPTMVSGSMTSNMATEQRPGKMAQNTSENT